LNYSSPFILAMARLTPTLFLVAAALPFVAARQIRFGTEVRPSLVHVRTASLN
jgi:hypothetical protein